MKRRRNSKEEEEEEEDGRQQNKKKSIDGLKYKKNGELDMRYKSSRDFVANQQMSSSSSSSQNTSLAVANETIESKDVGTSTETIIKIESLAVSTQTRALTPPPTPIVQPEVMEISIQTQPETTEIPIQTIEPDAVEMSTQTETPPQAPEPELVSASSQTNDPDPAPESMDVSSQTTNVELMEMCTQTIAPQSTSISTQTDNEDSSFLLDPTTSSLCYIIVFVLFRIFYT